MPIEQGIPAVTSVGIVGVTFGLVGSFSILAVPSMLYVVEV
ncbi:hypothetical protein [Bacillus sp. PK3_68]|nr:hypothetical protein [Bacillus sp. PK3_68]